MVSMLWKNGIQDPVYYVLQNYTMEYVDVYLQF